MSMEVMIYKVKLNRAGRDIFGTYHGKEEGKHLFHVREEGAKSKNRIDWFLRTKSLAEAKRRVLFLCPVPPHIYTDVR